MREIKQDVYKNCNTEYNHIKEVRRGKIHHIKVEKVRRRIKKTFKHEIQNRKKNKNKCVVLENY